MLKIEQEDSYFKITATKEEWICIEYMLKLAFEIYNETFLEKLLDLPKTSNQGFNFELFLITNTPFKKSVIYFDEDGIMILFWVMFELRKKELPNLTSQKRLYLLSEFGRYDLRKFMSFADKNEFDYENYELSYRQYVEEKPWERNLRESLLKRVLRYCKTILVKDEFKITKYDFMTYRVYASNKEWKELKLILDYAVVNFYKNELEVHISMILPPNYKVYEYFVFYCEMAIPKMGCIALWSENTLLMLEMMFLEFNAVSGIKSVPGLSEYRYKHIYSLIHCIKKFTIDA